MLAARHWRRTRIGARKSRQRLAERLYNEVFGSSEIIRYTGHSVLKVTQRTVHNKTGTQMPLRYTGNFIVEAFVVEAFDLYD